MVDIRGGALCHTALLDLYLERGEALPSVGVDVNNRHEVDITAPPNTFAQNEPVNVPECPHYALQRHSQVPVAECVEQPRQLLSRTPYSVLRRGPSQCAFHHGSEKKETVPVGGTDRKDFMSAIKLLRNKYRRSSKPPDHYCAGSSLLGQVSTHQSQPSLVQSFQPSKWGGHPQCDPAVSRALAARVSARGNVVNHEVSGGMPDMWNGYRQPPALRPARGALAPTPKNKHKMALESVWRGRTNPFSDRLTLDRPVRCRQPWSSSGTQDGQDMLHTPLLSSATRHRGSPGVGFVRHYPYDEVSLGTPPTPLTDSLRDFFTRQAALQSVSEDSTPRVAQNSLDEATSTAPRGKIADGRLKSCDSINDGMAEIRSLANLSSPAQHANHNSPLQNARISDTRNSPSSDDTQDCDKGVAHIRRLYPSLFDLGSGSPDVDLLSLGGKDELQSCVFQSAEPHEVELDAGTPLLKVCDHVEPERTLGQPASADRQWSRDSETIDSGTTDLHMLSTARREPQKCGPEDSLREAKPSDSCVLGLSGRANKFLQRVLRSAQRESADLSHPDDSSTGNVITSSGSADSSVQSLLKRAGISQHTIDMLISSQGLTS